MSDQRTPVVPEDPDIEPRQPRVDVSALEEDLASKPKKRPGLSGRLMAAIAALRGGEEAEEKPSILPLVIVTDHEDAFDANDAGNAKAERYITDLASTIRENVLPVPRGLTLTYVDQHHNVIDLTRNRK